MIVRVERQSWETTWITLRYSLSILSSSRQTHRNLVWPLRISSISEIPCHARKQWQKWKHIHSFIVKVNNDTICRLNYVRNVIITTVASNSNRRNTWEQGGNSGNKMGSEVDCTPFPVYRPYGVIQSLCSLERSDERSDGSHDYWTRLEHVDSIVWNVRK